MRSRALPPGYRRIAIPPERPGKRFLMMEMDADLVERTQVLLANGQAEHDLSKRLEDTIRQFFGIDP